VPAHLVVERGPYPEIATAEIRRRVRAMMTALQLKKEEVSIVLTDDDQIQELNRVYRQKDKPTDVLAFAQREGELAALAGPLLGDVIVSIPMARRQAAEAGRDVLAEVTMLLAHGLLHLLGWDHDTPAKDKRMRAETDRLCAAASPPPTPSTAKKRAATGHKEANEAAAIPLKGRTARPANTKDRPVKVRAR
jgi:probable rRNA maturation factor